MLSKDEFLERLRLFIDRGDTEWAGQTAMLKTLLEFFEKKDIPEHKGGGLLRNLPKYTVKAFEMTDKCPLSLTQVTACPVVYRTAMIRKLGFLLEEITGWNRIRNELESYCLAQDRVIEQYFDKFLKEVYFRGLEKLASEYRDEGLETRLGTTVLVVRPSGYGRAIIFWRKPYYQYDDNLIVSFQTKDAFCRPPEFLLKEIIAANFCKVIGMLEESIIRWPVNTEDQKLIFEVIKPPFQ